MKDKVKAGALFGMYVGVVYSIGAYFGYRLGKSVGEAEAIYSRNINEHIKKIPDESHEKHPQYLNEGEA